MKNKDTSTIILGVFVIGPILVFGYYWYIHQLPSTEPILGNPVYFVNDIIFSLAIVPVFISSFAAFLIIYLHDRLKPILVSSILIAIFWIEMVFTDVIIRSKYIALMDLFVFDFPIVTMPSIAITSLGSFAIFIFVISPGASEVNG